MAKKEITDFLDKAKKATVDAARVVADTAVAVADKTQEVVATTTAKIQDEIQEKKEAAIKARQDEVDAAMAELEGTMATSLLAMLGESPVELTKGHITKIKDIFPIPKEQCVLWADAEFDLRPSGIVCTEKGLFIKTNIELWGKKSKKKDGKKEADKSILFYYKWEDFDPSWFVSEDPEENRALLVEPQCTEHFVVACKELATAIASADIELSDLVFDDSEIEEMLAKVVPTGVAALQSAQSAVFVEQKAHINTPAGHGEMAEEAITLADRILGMDAKVVGRDNAKDGADIVNVR